MAVPSYNSGVAYGSTGANTVDVRRVASVGIAAATGSAVRRPPRSQYGGTDTGSAGGRSVSGSPVAEEQYWQIDGDTRNDFIVVWSRVWKQGYEWPRTIPASCDYDPRAGNPPTADTFQYYRAVSTADRDHASGARVNAGAVTAAGVAAASAASGSHVYQAPSSSQEAFVPVTPLEVRKEIVDGLSEAQLTAQVKIVNDRVARSGLL